MTLAVVTLVHAGTDPHWLRECSESVRTRLPQGACHIVAAGDDFQRARWDAYRSAEFVACVDHDDRLTGDSLRWCLDALAETGAGVAFTQEAQIAPDGNPLHVKHRRPRRIDVAMHPRPLHHLAVIRSSCIGDAVWDLAQEAGIGIDWLVRAWVALKHGAVHVPHVGYEWRRHRGQASALWAQRYETAIPALRRTTLSWMAPHEALHHFVSWHGATGDAPRAAAEREPACA